MSRRPLGPVALFHGLLLIGLSIECAMQLRGAGGDVAGGDVVRADAVSADVARRDGAGSRRGAVSEEDRQFWSFQKPVRPDPPAVEPTDRVRSPVDQFVLARLRERGLAFNPDAERRTLVRRLHLDLTGLPPAPRDVEAFARDPRPGAYERLVERLLASPRYGERWGRHWLDVAGFAESSLFIGDQFRPDFWRYRDYVIRAFNSDKPFDQFLIEQLAGDELFDWRAARVFSDDQIDKLVATGFLRCPPDATDNQAITQDEKIYAAQQSVVEVALKALLGLTLNCVRCHSHKYDPIPHEDYYRLVAVFQPALDPAKWLPGIYSRGRAGPIRAIPLLDRKGREEFFRHAREKKGEKKSSELPPLAWGLFDVSTQPSPTHILRRGNYETPAREVGPGVLTVLDDPDNPCRFPETTSRSTTTGRRLTLARWLVRPDHPLTARVMVNRVWHYHFGTGIVATPDDFGARGARPSHPDLLDWLAVEFVDSGWSVKHLQRLILLSTTYRQSSDNAPDGRVVDRRNRLLWRFPARRLEAEAVRDSMLKVSGQLDERLYGASVPTKKLADGRFVIAPDHEGRRRRTVYISTRRTWVPTFLRAFDAPVMDTNCPKRSYSAIPQQALAAMNNSFTIECAELFARRVLDDGGQTFTDRLDLAYSLAYGRPATPDEIAIFGRFMDAATLDADRSDDVKSWRTVCQALLSSSEFIYVD